MGKQPRVALSSLNFHYRDGFSKFLFCCLPRWNLSSEKWILPLLLVSWGPFQGFDCSCFHFVGKQKQASEGLFDQKWCTSVLRGGLKLLFPIDNHVIAKLREKPCSIVTIPWHNYSKTHPAKFLPLFWTESHKYNIKRKVINSGPANYLPPDQSLGG